MDELVRDFMDAAYDTGHYAGDGRSGTDLHRERIKERGRLSIKLDARLTAADALAVAGKKLKEAVGNSDAEFCNMAIREWQAALRQYRETR